jgi:hypothetical protein
VLEVSIDHIDRHLLNFFCFVMGTVSLSRDAITLWTLEYVALRNRISVSGHTFAGSNVFYTVCVFAECCVTTNKFTRFLLSPLWGFWTGGFSIWSAVRALENSAVDGMYDWLMNMVIMKSFLGSLYLQSRLNFSSKEVYIWSNLESIML